MITVIIKKVKLKKKKARRYIKLRNSVGEKFFSCIEIKPMLTLPTNPLSIFLKKKIQAT